MNGGAPLPLSHLVIGECTNAPLAANSPLFFDGDSRSQEDAVFDDFPPAPESFFPNPIFYTLVDAFLTDHFLDDDFYWCGHYFWA